MSEMIERVAKAMWQGVWDRAKANERRANEAAERDVYFSYVPKWEDCNLIFLSYARAAIEAMRKPTDEMIRAGSLHQESLGKTGISISDTWSVYEATIDAALK